MIPIKFEKINENKIKCILTKQDLENKDIRISELAYGSKKAKELFREMMEKAQTEINFDAENCPLMIEAVPMMDETLVIFITKVDNPDELDTRFSKFTKAKRSTEEGSYIDNDENGYTGVSDKFDDDIDDEYDDDDMDEEKSSEDKPIEREITAEINIPKNSNIDTQQILDAIGNIAGELAASLGDGIKNTVKNLKEEQKADNKADKKEENNSNEDKGKNKNEQQDIYIFKDLKSIISAAKFVNGIFEGDSYFFKNPNDGRLYLYINGEEMNDRDYARVGIILGEYGSRCRITYSSFIFFEEHFKCIRANDAIEFLSQI
ncbi:MAG: adaptor protein MecA [Eubacterium sp.]|nr:adaptor protein MecA [Eubacterium sp.]